MDSYLFLFFKSTQKQEEEGSIKFFEDYETNRDSNVDANINKLDSIGVDDLAEISIQDSALNEIHYKNNLAEINSYQKLEENWDSYNANAPSLLSIENARTALTQLYEINIHPSNISPTSDGGVLFRFNIPGGYILIEFHDNGDIVFLSKANGDREVSEISIEDLANFFRQRAQNVE